MQDTEIANECINWIEEILLKYYEYNHFRNIRKICPGGFGKVFRAFKSFF